MKTSARQRHHVSKPLLLARGLSVFAPGGRPLFRELNLAIGEREKVAMIGRNGSGKSTLLEILAGRRDPQEGEVMRGVAPVYVEQELVSAPEAAGLSAGELRRKYLAAAKRAEPELLLLDEPTQDLDAEGIAWLADWLASLRGGLLLVSHDRRLLRGFRDFFLVSEAGCRCFSGTLEGLEQELERDRMESEAKYVRNLNLLVERERHNAKVAAGRQRKKNRGRVNELDRSPARLMLNRKRSYAQVKQGRLAKLRRERIATMREWARSTRRALAVSLPLELVAPVVPADRTLFDGHELHIGARDRIAVVGPNGSGKTTLLDRVRDGARSIVRIGSIAQRAVDWISDETLLSAVAIRSGAGTLDDAARLLVAHRFPLALAQRPMSSLSPGERVRAALICLWCSAPPPELLILDEPTDSLDFEGSIALRTALKAWPGALLIASHDRDLLAGIGIQRWIDLRSPPGAAPVRDRRSSR